MNRKFDWITFKKDLRFISLIIVGISILILLMWMVAFKPFSKTDFTILKNECQTSEFIRICQGGCLNYLQYSIEDNVTILNQCYSECEKDSLNKALNFDCEQKEVEEIKLKIEVDSCRSPSSYAMDYCGYDIRCIKKYVKENNSTRCQFEVINNVTQIYQVKTIKKSYLTIEWLDENCECIKCLNKEDNFGWLGNENCKKDSYDECYRYKCGDYQVEVKE